MWLPSAKSSNAGRKGGNGLVAVAIDKDKGSQNALKWTIENLLLKGQTVILIHVVHKSASLAALGNDVNGAVCTQRQALEKQTRDLFLTFHCFCTRKDIQCIDVVLEDSEIAKAITEYVAYAAIENLVLGSARHGFIRRLKMADVPSSVSKGAPDFCSVYVISKTKISSVKNASRPAPFASPLYSQIQKLQEQANGKNGNSPNATASMKAMPSLRGLDRTPRKAPSVMDETELANRSPFARGRLNPKMFADLSESDTDISFISSDRPSTDRMSVSIYDGFDSCRNSRMSTSSDSSFASGTRASEFSSITDFSTSSVENDDVEAEMRRLKLELVKTMEMYSTACKEALTAKQKAVELHRWRMEEERRLEEAKLKEEAARLMVEEERNKCRAAQENAEAAQRIAEIEAQRRRSAELKALKESDDKQKALCSLAQADFRYRRYSIEEIEEATGYFNEQQKIGEGGYGPVFKCYLDHTPVAVKVLRPDAAQGRSQFQQEVEVLSCMRHPNIILLLGACPEYGCLVYEHLANGNLEDLLFRKGNTPPLSWQIRFQIAAEIGTGLLFLHQTKPEPLVHRDLKPANILLDHNYVSKIGDVGLARLVPPTINDEVTQYRMTSTAGTFCYIDPEYQQTGMLGVKSDVYSFGIVLLQLLTGKPAMGLTHYVGRAIEKGTIEEVLDSAVPDWPVEEALNLAKLALQCAELRRKDRPDLGKIVLPELNRLRVLGNENMLNPLTGAKASPSPLHSNASIPPGVQSDPQIHEQSSSSVAPHSTASLPE